MSDGKRNAVAIEVKGVGACKSPGEFTFTGRYERDGTFGMVFCCPCGCGALGSLRFDNDPDADRPKWTWDGNREKPTLAPSILKTTGSRWHGYLRAGVFEEC